MEYPVFRFSNVIFDNESKRLTDLNGRLVQLRHKSLSVLGMLADRPGHTIRRQEFIDTVWDGAQVSEDSLAKCIAEIRRAIGDDRKRAIETIPRKGYRLAVGGDSPRRRPFRSGAAAAGAALGAVVAVVALLVLATVVWPDRSKAPVERLASPIVPIVAVLPFENLSSDPDHQFFAHGLAGDLITDLTKIEGVGVISRTSSFAVDQRLPVSVIAERLRARYVVEGSVRRVGRTLRITASLVDARGDRPVWSERFDGATGDVFMFQDRIIADIIDALRIELTPGERSVVEARGTENPAAYDAYLRGLRLSATRRRLDVESNAAAQAAFEEAIRLDPDYALAYAGLAWTKWLYYATINYYGDPNEAFRLAEKSLALADNALAHRTLARRHFSLQLIGAGDRDIEAAVEQLEAARRLQPGDPDVLVDLASALAFSARPKDAEELVRRAMELNPSHPDWYYGISGIAYLLTAQAELAVRDLSLWAKSTPNWETPPLFLASAYGLAGDEVRAREQLDLHIKLCGLYTLYAIDRTWPMAAPEQEIFRRGLKVAGIRTSMQ